MSVFSIPFLVLGVIVALINWIYLLSSFRRCYRVRASFIPFVGAVFGAIAIALSPTLPNWAWALVFVDPGTIAGIASLPAIVQTTLRFSSLNLHAELSSSRHRLRLYRHGEFQLEYEPPDTGETLVPMVTGAGGSWHMDRDNLVLQFQGHVLELTPTEDENQFMVRAQDASVPMALGQSTAFHRTEPRRTRRT